MKKEKCISYFLLTLLLFACKEEDPIVDKPLVVSNTYIILSPDKPYAEITILKGAGDYMATSSNIAVAQPMPIDNKLYITGYNIGDALVTLTDKDSNQVQINVTINTLIPRVYPLSHLVFIKVGDTKHITSSNPNPLYFLLDTTSAISVGGTANNVRITGRKKGNAFLYYLKDYWPTLIYDIKIVDHYIFAISPTTSYLRLAVGAESTYHIMSGCGNYTLTVSNTDVISAELQDWPVVPAFNENNPRVVNIKALQKGTTELKIIDVETSEEKTITVNVI